MNVQPSYDKDLLKITIDGKEIICEKGKTVLEAAKISEIDIPTLCHDERLESYGGCRLCLVEIKGINRPLPSCTTPVTEGMEVTTESNKLTLLRRSTLSLLLSNHPNDCMLCEKTGDCRLQDLVYRYNVRWDHFEGQVLTLPLKEDNPFITFDPGKCILCGRCVRICNEIVMAETIDMTGRGFNAMPGTAFGKPHSLDNCEFCGQCISTCPVGALTAKPSKGMGRSYDMKKVKTTCTYCGTGCNFYLNVKDNKVVRVTSDYDSPVNKGNLCIKGRFGYEFIHHPDRLTTPLIRKGNKFHPVSWDEALDIVADKFKKLLIKYGPDAAGAFSSARCTNEENFLLAKWVRACFGSNNVDNCARVCHAPTVAGLAKSFGAGAATNSFDQIAGADTLFVIGSNTTEGHPIVSLHLKKALQNGARLIVADPRRIELVKYSDVWLNLRPGGNIALLNGLIHIIFKEGWENRYFISQRTEGVEELKKKVSEYTLDRVESITGVSGEKLRTAARLYAKAENAMILYGLGVTEHLTGTENAIAIANLALACGQIGRPSTGVMALRGQNNVQGACDVGPLPNALPGYHYVTDEKSRAKFEKAWNIKVSSKPGLKTVEMLDEALKGNFKGMYLLGIDPAHTDPNLHHVRKALQALEFLVVQDIFPTETTQFAHVILPGASFAEKDGTFTNGERRVQRIRKAIEPLSGMAEWQVICELSTRMGYPMKYNHSSEIMDEIASLAPAYGGINYKRLEKESLQWPCPAKGHQGTTTLYKESFSRPGGLAAFIPLDHKGSGENIDRDYPFILITGRRREHYNNGSMTRRVKGIMELCPEELLEINPKDANRLNIKDGDMVKVASKRGEIQVKVKITDRSQEGMLFLSFHYQNALTNLVTSEFRDEIAGTPEYKACAVKIIK